MAGNDGKEGRIRRLAKRNGKYSRLITLVKSLGLQPEPTGDDIFSWRSSCPRGNRRDLNHIVAISTKDNLCRCRSCGSTWDARALKRVFDDVASRKLEPLFDVVKQQVGSLHNVRKIRFVASWCYGDCEASITLSAAEWSCVKKGTPFSKEGKGYYYEGEKFHDYWLFNHDEPGSLEVDYDDAGQGFVGDIVDVDEIQVN